MGNTYYRHEFFAVYQITEDDTIVLAAITLIENDAKGLVNKIGGHYMPITTLDWRDWVSVRDTIKEALENDDPQE